MKIKYLLLETIETLRKINPWRVDISEEINKIRELLSERLNLVIAGIAADNASYIFSRKVDEIERIVKRREKPYSEERPEIDLETYIPEVDIRYGPQKYMIDLTEMIEKLEELLEKEVSKKFSTPDIEPTTEDLLAYTQEEIKRAENFIISYIHATHSTSLITLFKEGIKHNIHPLYILYAIVFLEQEGIILVEPIYGDGETINDLIIRKEA